MKKAAYWAAFTNDYFSKFQSTNNLSVICSHGKIGKTLHNTIPLEYTSATIIFFLRRLLLS